MSDDTAMAHVARDLADALMLYARGRRAEDKHAVADLQTQLCATRRAERAVVIIAEESENAP